MHLGDSIFIFILALVLFGPKKLPEMARQIGKLMAEFRRASNDFRLQIDEELRTMERQEQQQKQEAERASLAAGLAVPSVLPPVGAGELTAGNSMPPGAGLVGGALQILPPGIGEQVSAGTPYAVSAETDDLRPAEDHPLLQVSSIPVDPSAAHDQPTGMAAAEANAALLNHHPVAGPEPTSGHTTSQDQEQASLQNG